MISMFIKLRNNDGRATVLTYAHFHTFKFPDSMAVHIRCKVEICHFGCPDHCQRPTAGNPIGDYSRQQAQFQQQALVQQPNDAYAAPAETAPQHEVLPNNAGPSSFGEKSISERLPFYNTNQRQPGAPGKAPPSSQNNPMVNNSSLFDEGPLIIQNEQSAQVCVTGSPLKGRETIGLPNAEDFPWGPRNLRRRRRDLVLDRHQRSPDIGVTTDYQVISEADLELSPARDEGVTVFKGQRQDVYGVCLPAPGFSALCAAGNVHGHFSAGGRLHVPPLADEKIPAMHNDQVHSVESGLHEVPLECKDIMVPQIYHM
ncbi:uncharacterized protein LOC122267702 [Penaeus japonicus]|uniref:uncharacterized protein LOC122267702 n=1 Tax=Penaeus japonicus TaxID=27405 RepID=UPI001C716CBF|nr:uncharacterized protein LOC122267702 [Penaeus japonicus]